MKSVKINDVFYSTIKQFIVSYLFQNNAECLIITNYKETLSDDQAFYQFHGYNDRFSILFFENASLINSVSLFFDEPLDIEKNFSKSYSIMALTKKILNDLEEEKSFIFGINEKANEVK